MKAQKTQKEPKELGNLTRNQQMNKTTTIKYAR
jgi:hypothetical protein